MMPSFLAQEAQKRGLSGAVAPTAASPAAPTTSAPAPAPAPAAAPTTPAAAPPSFLAQEAQKRGLSGVDASQLDAPSAQTTVRPITGITKRVEVPEVTTLAANAGVVFDRPAPAGHFLASFAYNDVERAKAFKNSLSERFGESAEIRVGKDTKQLEYYIKGQNRYGLVNPPGANMADIEGMAGPATVLVPEAVAGMTTAFIAKNPALVSLGAGVGAFTGEMLRLSMGKEMGINQDVTTGQMVKSALKEGGLSAVSGIALDNLVRFGKFIADVRSNRVVPPGTARALGLDTNAAQDIVDQVNKINGENSFRVNLAQATGDEDLLSMQEFYSRSTEFSGRFREFSEDQNAALRTFYDKVNAPYKSRENLLQTEEMVKARAQTGMDVTTTKNNLLLDMRRVELEQSLQSVKTRPIESLGFELREVGSQEQAAFKEWGKAAAKDLNAVAGNAELIPNSSTFGAVTKLTEESKAALLRSMKSSKQKLVGERVLGREGDQVVLLGPDGEPLSVVNMDESEAITKIFDKDAKFTFEEAWGAVSYLKSLERAASRGLSTDLPEVGDIKFLRGALERDLRDGMQGSPLRGQYEQFINKYSYEKRRLDEGMIGRMMERKGGPMGRFVVADEQVFKQMFVPGVKRNAQEVRNLIENDPAAMQGMRETIMDFYQREAVVDGTVDLKAHERFVKQYKEPLSVFFGKAEMAMVNKPAGLQRAIKAREAANAKTLKDLNGTFGSQLTNLKPGNMMNFIFDSNNPHKAELVMDIVGKNPEIKRAVQAHTTKEISERIAGQYKNGDRQFSSARLDEMLSGKAGTKGHSRAISHVMGDQYVADLKVLNDALKLTSKEAQNPNRSNTAFWSDTIKVMSKAYFGVISKEGRYVTALDKFRARAANRIFAKAIMNADDLRELAKLSGVDPLSRKAINLMGAFGGSALLQDFGPPEEQRPLPTGVFEQE